MAAPRKHQATTKLPVPISLRCSMMDGRGKGCERIATYLVERIDGSTFKVCGLDALKLREQYEAHREQFATLRFVAINKRGDVVS